VAGSLQPIHRWLTPFFADFLSYTKPRNTQNPMKPRHLQFLPRTLMVCVAPLLLCASAQAQVMIYNESNATGEWNVRAGTNLLAGATVVADSLNPADPVIPPPVQEGSTSSSWATLSDGILGTPGGTTPPYKSQTVAPSNGGTVTYALNLTGHPDGYDITSFDSYCMWGDGNRDDQNYAIQYSTDGVFFNNLATVANRNNLKATHTNLTDASGVLASGVKYVKVIFGASPAEGQENGYTGFSEFILRADPTNVVTTLESNISTAGFTLPAGTNLLNGATASPLTTAAHEGSSPDWTTLTNGLLGVGTDTAASVTPNNGTSVIFPLNTLVNFNGYNLTSIDTYSAWANSGRDNQMLNISYSKVGTESVFIPLGTAVINTGDPTSATHVKLSAASGFLATGVAAIKFDTGHQENGYVGLREFIALGTAVSISDALTWTGAGGSGGNASWIAGADNNWKKTIGGTAATFSPLAALTFDNLPTNRNINIPAPLTASSIALNNDATHPYTFGGSLVTVSNDILSTGAGTTTFNNPISAITGVTQSGTGQLVFNGALGSAGVTLSGTGGITLNAANPALTGTVAVSNGVLTVSNNGGLQSAGLSMSGFDATSALFTSAAPAVTSISSTQDSPAHITLGKTAGTVNTNLTVGDAASVTAFRGVISQATGTVGSLTKTGASSLTLSGENTYSGPTSVLGGTLTFSQLQALYGGQPSAWTAGNLVVGSGATLAFEVGDSGEFTESNIDSDLSLGGFGPGSFLGINTNIVDATLSRNLTQPGLGLVKSGNATLNLTGANTSNGTVKLFGGALNADSTTGTAINGDLQIGKGLMNVVFNFGGNNQLAPTSVITFTNGNFYSSKVNLRGTSQTISGLDGSAFPANKVTVIQNDEVGQPGYTEPPGDASLTINATSNHSFYGLIRNQEGGVVSVTKNGPGIQEFKNLHDVQGYGYTGPPCSTRGRSELISPTRKTVSLHRSRSLASPH
jgi:autotransporter-associated beta strand protein